MRRSIVVTLVAVLAVSGNARAAKKKPAKKAAPAGPAPSVAPDPSTAVPAGGPVNPVANMLSKAQIEDGWVCLFDGLTHMGWKINGSNKIADGVLTLGGEKAATATTTAKFGSYELKVEAAGSGAEIVLNGKTQPLTGAFEAKVADSAKALPVVIKVPAGKTVQIKKIVLKPLGEKSLFNGKDLSGWKEVPDHKSVFTVNDKGQINVKNGNGDLQSEWQGADFVLQIDVISNGKSLNSGIFFRSRPGEFWQGYEAQIRNEWNGYSKDEKRNAEKEDRTKAVDFGTGALYNRQYTRKVVSSDHEWFTMTVVANGAHISTWVNGFQCTDYVDKEADAQTARKGRFLGKGCISIQGHDPTTDLSFKNIRVAELPKD